MNDLISRQAALGALGERPVVWLDNDDYTLGARNQYDMDRLALETVPSAQPEPHEGHWIPVHPIQSDDPGAYMCSKCKTGMWEIRPSAYHYCPNCGAKMDKDEGD